MGGASNAGIRSPTTRTRLLYLLIRPMAPSLRLGIAVAGTLIVVETIVVCSLKVMSGSTAHFGTLFLLGVVVVSTVWGFGLSLTMSVASAVAFAYFRNWPTHHFAPFEPQNLLVIAVFLVVALVANGLARLTRMGGRSINLSSDLMCIAGPDRVVQVNPAFTQILGYSLDDLVSRPFLDLIVPDDRGRARAVLEELHGSATPARFESRVFCSDGSQRWIAWSVVWHRGLFYVAGHDVTESRREQEQLRQAEAAAMASRDKLGVLAEQQAALRRVATLVARGASPSEVFAAVADELAGWLHSANATVVRFDDDRTLVIVALGRLEPGLTNIPLIGQRLSLEGDNLAARVLRSGRAARMDSYENAPGPVSAQIRAMGLRGTVGVPIIVNGRVWGMAALGSPAPDPLPPDTEARVGDFADLVATAIANAATRAELQARRAELGVLAERQAALRRVATLVAQGTPPSEVFLAVTEEMARCLDAGNASVNRFDGDTVTVLALDRLDPGLIKHKVVVGERHTLEGDNIATRVLHTGRAARLEGSEFQNAPGSIAARLRLMGLRCVVAVPIIVDGRVWGMAAVGSSAPEPLPPDTEARLGDFADLVAIAIANAATRAELIASRARIVAATDDARRRLERDLHDGAQRRLVSLGLQLRMAEESAPPELGDFKQQLSRLLSGLTGVSADLQEISRGIHPAILSRGGLGPALKTLARRSAVPVTLDLTIDRRIPDSAEVAAYYVVAEALTNTAKHARASEVNVGVETEGGSLRVLIRDDGVGGANSHKGSGLIGLQDRVEALGGRLHVTSPPESGTSLRVSIPLDCD